MGSLIRNGQRIYGGDGDDEFGWKYPEGPFEYSKRVAEWLMER